MGADAVRLRLWILATLGMAPGCGPERAGADTVSEKTTESAGSESGEPTAYVCLDPQPIIVDGRESGFVRCEETGAIHREVAVPGPWSQSAAGSCPGPMYGLCAEDADCTDAPGGRCIGSVHCTCVYARACEDDATCGEGFTCSALDGECIVSGCRTSDDCGDGWTCGYSQPYPRCGIGFTPRGELHCHGPSDECASDADCEDKCLFVEDAWRCAPSAECDVYGRPFFVDGRPRVAGTVAREGWGRASLENVVDQLSAHARARLGEHWLTQAQMEHASVAAFARHTLHLLAVGAPAALVADAQVAMGDELRHAEIGFALARVFSGRLVGPGPLDLDGACTSLSVSELAALVFAEGCIGESCAALLAMRAASAVRDPALRATLLGIAEDEATHAAMAWRFIRWALARGGDDVRRRLGAILREHEREPSIHASESAFVAVDPHDLELRAHGCLPDVELRQARRDAIRGIVLPCARTLLGDPPPDYV